MIDANGLIRAAGGPRPKDDLVQRLLKPSGTSWIDAERGHAAAALREQEAELARLVEVVERTAWAGQRATERAEAELAAARKEVERLGNELRRECDDADKICRKLNLPGSRRTDGGSLHLPRIFAAIDAARLRKQEAELTRLLELDAYNTDIIARFAEKLKQAEAERDALLDTLIRLSKWDHLNTAADGPFWKLEIANAIDAAREKS